MKLFPTITLPALSMSPPSSITPDFSSSTNRETGGFGYYMSQTTKTTGTTTNDEGPGETGFIVTETDTPEV